MHGKNNTGFALACLLVLTGLILTYSNHFHNDFHFDDTHTITNNPHIRNIGNLPVFFTDMRTFGSMQDNLGYRPVVTASTAIDYWIAGGYNPFYFHLSMFVVFVLQGLLMFFILLKIFNLSLKNQWNRYLALFLTAFYLFHPGNAETINYIIARSDSYSTFFVILAMLCYMNKGMCRKYFLYLIPAGLGILCKETAVMFPLLLFVYILFFEQKASLTCIFGSQRKQFFKSIVRVLPALIFTLALALMVQLISYSQTHNSGILHTNTGGMLAHFKYIITQPYVLLTYFVSFFAPVNLSSDPDVRAIGSLSDIRLYTGIAFMVFMLWIAFLASKKDKYRPVAFGILWFFIAAIPTSLLSPLTQLANSHRLFFLYVGLVIAVGWALYLFVLKIREVFTPRLFQRSLLVLVVLALLFLAYGTRERNKVWKTEASLWYDIYLKGPENPRALVNYGLTLMANAQYDDADYYFRKALKIWPYWPYLHINMGILNEAQGNIAVAEQYYQTAVRCSNKGNPDAKYYYGKFLYGQKRYDQAMANLLGSLEESHAYMNARYLLMTIYSELAYWDFLQKMVDETLEILPGDKTALQFQQIAAGKKSPLQQMEEEVISKPTPEGYLNLSLNYYNLGEYQKCIDACNEALKLKPDFAEAYNNICSAYNALQMWDKGADACRKALELKPDYELARNNLKWALSEH